jgi:O-methyltransferase involved in polyketide biosynthesis
MSDTTSRNLNGVAEALLIPLYIRATESQRADPLIRDEKAVELVAHMSLDVSRVRRIPLSEVNKLVIILRNREFDTYARDFMARHPYAALVHIGCGLDTRFQRVDDGRVEWYDLDFPHVIELRRKILGDEAGRYHLLGCSVLDNAWLDTVSAYGPHPLLFLAEGVFMYFEAAQVKSLVLTLRDRFLGAELVFDAFSPLHLWRSNLQTARSGFRCRWGIWHGEEIERWGDGIRLLREWGFFDRPQPRLARVRWLRPIEALARTLRIYHFRLGAAGASGGRP